MIRPDAHIWKLLSPQQKLESIRREGCYRCGGKDFLDSTTKLVCIECKYNYWIEPDKSDGLFRSYTISEEHINGRQADASKWNTDVSKGFLN